MRKNDKNWLYSILLLSLFLHCEPTFTFRHLTPSTTMSHKTKSDSYADAARQPATMLPARECTKFECQGHTSSDGDTWKPRDEHLSLFWNLHRDCSESIWFWGGSRKELLQLDYDPHYTAMIAAGRIME